jgi:hypothetical protein
MVPRMDEEMLDINHCLQKEAEYYAKARATTDPKLKGAYEATAREFAFRVQQFRSKKEKPL